MFAKHFQISSSSSSSRSRVPCGTIEQWFNCSKQTGMFLLFLFLFQTLTGTKCLVTHLPPAAPLPAPALPAAAAAAAAAIQYVVITISLSLPPLSCSSSSCSCASSRCAHFVAALISSLLKTLPPPQVFIYACPWRQPPPPQALMCACPWRLLLFRLDRYALLRQSVSVCVCVCVCVCHYV